MLFVFFLNDALGAFVSNVYKIMCLFFGQTYIIKR